MSKLKIPFETTWFKGRQFRGDLLSITDRQRGVSLDLQHT